MDRSILPRRWAPAWDRLRQRLRAWDAYIGPRHLGLLWLEAALYKFALDAMYVWAASPMYSYAGLEYEPSFVRYCAASLMYLALFWALPKGERDAAAFLLHLQFLFTAAPMLTFFALGGGSGRYMLMVFVCLLAQTWVVRRSGRNRAPVTITGVRNYVTVALGVLLVFTLAIPVLYNGFEGLKAFDFVYIYTMRATASYPPGFTYLLSWMTSAILPFALLMFLERKRYGLALLCLACQLLFYMETGQKFSLLVLAPVLAVYLLSKTGHLLKLMYAGFILLCKAFFSEGLIGQMFSLSYPYAGSLGQVSFAYTGGTFLSANLNTGYLGDAYAQMGFVGMLLMSLLLGWILRGVGVYTKKGRFCVGTALFSLYMITLNDGALFTTLFTGGMLLSFLLLFIYFDNQTEECDHGIQRL